IADPYFAFWFRYVHPNVDLIETGQGDFLVELVMENLSEYLGWVFENIAKDFLIKLNRAGKLPFRFTKIGRWWGKGGKIDLVALNERERKALLVEVKWKDLSEREARGILRDLERKSQLVGLDDWEKNYRLVAKSVEGKEELKNEGWLVWDLEDFEKLIKIGGN
ncbi:MAG: DUF234 domain-containing protein, partial [Archaeoglobus sp.]|uniref:DUF234 domain-containing protein n=1 Tax=Archaeoglobus sp. TaxID=1872626 RepID=UPI001DB17895